MRTLILLLAAPKRAGSGKLTVVGFVAGYLLS
jgi:hypothetical protein